jgi:hypothetical protein
MRDVAPELFVLSRNVHRRHLTQEQKRSAIATFIKTAPQKSNREVAKTHGVSDRTVAEVRSAQNAQNAQIAHLPKERAKQALAENPRDSIAELAGKAAVSERTVVNAKRVLAEQEKPDPQSDAPPAEPKIDPVDAKLLAMWEDYGGKKVTLKLFRELVSDAVKVPGSLSIVKAALGKFQPPL